MKKITIGLVLLVLLSVALLAGMSGSGWRMFGMGVAWNTQKAELEQLAASFLEDVQFKDFDKAAKYHTFTDQGKADLPKLIERLFQVKPEQLNISNIQITRVDLDSAGKRARTFFKANTELLNSAQNPREEQNREREVEGILYWHKRPLREAFPAPAAGEEGKPAGPDPVAQAIEDLAQSDPEGPVADGERWYMMLESSLH